MYKILVTIPVNEAQKAILTAAAPMETFIYEAEGTVREDTVRQADIIVGSVPARLLAKAEKLRLMQTSSAGVDGYIGKGCLHERTILASASGAYGKSVAEHMFAMLLALQKNLFLYRDDQNNRIWKDHGEVTSVAGWRILVVGLGDIGRHFAAMARALGSYVIGVRRHTGADSAAADMLLPMERIGEVLGEVDVVASFLPNTTDTYRIYDDAFFSKMKDTAVFLNGGRGSAVDQAALLRALKNGTIASAGLDVTDPEPLPANDELYELTNVMITPHVAGRYHLADTLDLIVDIAAYNIRQLLTGGALKNVVDKEKGLPVRQ